MDTNQSELEVFSDLKSCISDALEWIFQ